MAEVLITQFKKQILNLINDLQEVFPEETDLLLINLFLDTAIDPKELIDGFEVWVYPWKPQIVKRDDKFFKENDHCFGPLPKNKVDKIRNMWFNGSFDESDKNTLWNYFEIYIKIIEKYKKLV